MNFSYLKKYKENTQQSKSHIMEEYYEQLPKFLEEANEQRKKNGEQGVSIAEATIALAAACWWAQTVCGPSFDNGCDDPSNNRASFLAMKNANSINEEAKKLFIEKVTKHFMVKLPKYLWCDYHPDDFFKKALGDDFPTFENNFPWKKYFSINWETGEMG